jgi:hypothetical protein
LKERKRRRKNPLIGAYLPPATSKGSTDTSLGPKVTRAVA